MARLALLVLASTIAALSSSSGTPLPAAAATPGRPAMAIAIVQQVEGNLAFRRPVAADPPPSPKYGRGALALLTDGVRGTSDFAVHWLGWEAVDFDLTLNVGAAVGASRVTLSTLYDQRHGILHPRRVTCSVSSDGARFQEVQTLTVDGDQRSEAVIRPFEFTWTIPFVRYIKLHVEGTKQLPSWHPSAGAGSWVFIDEIIVR